MTKLWHLNLIAAILLLFKIVVLLVVFSVFPASLRMNVRYNIYLKTLNKEYSNNTWNEYKTKNLTIEMMRFFVNLEGLSSNCLIQDLNWILKLNIWLLVVCVSVRRVRILLRYLDGSNFSNLYSNILRNLFFNRLVFNVLGLIIQVRILLPYWFY